MKRFVSVLVSAAVMLSSAPVFAADAAQTELLTSVKARIPATDGYESFKSSVSERENGTEYGFYWSTSGESYEELYVRADKNGVITEFMDYDSENDDYGTKRTVSEAEAEKKAKLLFEKLNPMLKDKYELRKAGEFESLYGGDFEFVLQRTENGIDVCGDDGFVNTDPSAERIKSFNISYTDGLVFDTDEGMIDRAAAEAAYKEKLGMKLVYRRYRDYSSRKTTIKPVYIPAAESNEYINAHSGEIERIAANDDVRYASSDSAGSSGLMNMKEEAADFTAAEREELENVSGLMSKAELEKKLRGLNCFSLNGFEITSFNVYKDSFDEIYYANIYMEKKNEYGRQAASFTMNARTGRLIAANAYGDSDTVGKTKLKEAVLSEKADKIANYLAADVIGEYKRETDGRGGSARYTRYINDTAVEFDTITVSLNEYTGEIESYDLSYTEAEFPTVKAVIGGAAAAERLFAAAGYEKLYVPQKSSEALKYADKFVLVYALGDETPQTVDAVTGDILGYGGETYTKRVRIEYTDIEGHYAEEAIRALGAYGISLGGGEFCPNKAVTQSDFLRLLLAVFKHRTFDEGTDEAEIYRAARRNDIIRSGEEDAEAEISRGTAATLIVRALGISEYAELDGIYKTSFSDVDGNVGAISILAAMGVFGGDGNGHFNPNGILTRGDAMIALNNYLNR